MKVVIKNYQAIKDVELEFKPGITAIVGNSNNGKSSIIRSLEAAINNKGGDSFINYDADQCEVTIEDNGSIIKWVKSKKQGKSHYIINGQKLSKIGQKQIPEVGELLNMNEVEVNNERFRLNFWKQLDYPFLVGKTSYQLFDFISKSDEQDLIKKYQDDNKVSLKTLGKDIETKSTQIDTTTEDIVSLEKEIEELKVFEDFNLEVFEDTLSDYAKLIALLSTYEANEIDLNLAKTELNDANTKLKGAEKLVEKIGKGLIYYEALSISLSSLKEINDSLASAKVGIKGCTNMVNSNTNKIKQLKSVIKNIDLTTDTIHKYRGFILLYNNFESEIKEEKKFIKKTEFSINEREKELAEFDVCPFCGSDISKHDHS